MNKQLIIHIAAELLIIGTVTFLINKRITKLETIITNYETTNTQLVKKLQMLESIVLNQANQIKQLMGAFSTPTIEINKMNSTVPSTVQTNKNVNKREQNINFSPTVNTIPTPSHTPSFSAISNINNPLTSMFSQFFGNAPMGLNMPIIEMEVPLFNPNMKYERNVEKGEEFEIMNEEPKVMVEDEDEKKLNTISEEDEDKLVEQSLNRILEETTNDEKVNEN